MRGTAVCIGARHLTRLCRVFVTAARARRSTVMKTTTPNRGRVRVYRSALTAPTLTFLLHACAAAPPPRAPTQLAAQNPCGDAKAWRDDLRILEPKTVLGIEPHYWRNTCDGTSQVIGTQIVLRRPEDSSSAALSWMLRCGPSRVLVGKDNPSMPPTSLLWLPDGWLDVGVKPDGGNFLVTLSAESVPKNIQLFHHAVDFLGPRSAPGTR